MAIPDDDKKDQPQSTTTTPSSSHSREGGGSSRLKSSRSDPIPPVDEDGNGFDSLEVVKAAWKRMQLRQDHDVMVGACTSSMDDGVSPLSHMGESLSL